VRPEGGRYRVLMGPWRDRDDALAAVRSLRRSRELQPFIVSR
jgi:cell division protein FtsN